MRPHRSPRPAHFGQDMLPSLLAEPFVQILTTLHADSDRTMSRSGAVDLPSSHVLSMNLVLGVLFACASTSATGTRCMMLDVCLRFQP